MEKIPVLREMMLPRDENVWGRIGGSKILEMIDLASGTEAMKYSKGYRVVTVAFKEVIFKAPVYSADIVSIYAKLNRIGRTSLTLDLEAEYLRRDGTAGIAATAQTVFVAIDDDGNPVQIGEDEESSL